MIDHNLGFENALDSGKTITFPSEKERKHLFPRVLLRRNVDEAVQLAECIMFQSQNSKLLRHCKVFIQRQPGIRCQDLVTFQWPGTKGVQPQEGDDVVTYEFKEITDDNQKRRLINEAAEISPLNAVRVDQEVYRKEISKRD